MNESNPVPPEREPEPAVPVPESAEVFVPVPAKESRLWHSFWTGAAVLAASGGIIFVLSGGLVGRTAGASRSTQLKWEERARQIERVERECQAESATEDSGATDTSDQASDR